ncbi:TolC family protein [Flavihumibacter solisilvae]|uniref:Transporter n=1 Tax=Flavihumibacter solisilvae TaxID=1349421 RepID=A0A0C1L4X5_9BACT|nr:TolC family protein [Flavihumibacter solisilvae]KIC94596.1 transporter [Flavihumibacter solisilvae]
MRYFFMLLMFLVMRSTVVAQPRTDTTLPVMTLQQAVAYSLEHQPTIRQAMVDEEITDQTIRSKLADWFPQVNFAYTYQRNFKIQTAVIDGRVIELGVKNVSAARFMFSQTIFNRDVLLASSTKREVRLQAEQNTGSEKIETVASVSKAYYDVLSSMQQVKVASENIVRIDRSLRDAYNQYKAGVADKTDYKRATIALNNAKADLHSNQELLKAKLEYLKTLMGFPVEQAISLSYDSLKMEQDAVVDTTMAVDFTGRIEYKLLQTQQHLLEANLKYNRWAFLPSLELEGAYNFNYQNQAFKSLFSVNYPNSYALFTLAFPIFQGGKRRADIRSAEFQVERNKLELLNLKQVIHSEYAQAIAVYKSSLANYVALKENLALAKEVYDVIQLQYKNGIKTYLEVINSETDLRTASINYYTALYNLLASKVDVQRSLGLLTY